jgi:hypothetical protein
MIYLLYSNDYEVFFGANYHPENEVLIETPERALSACEEIGVPMTLLCDLLCVWRYREQGHTLFPDSVDAQLKRAVQKGHDVQVHIHPHWPATGIIHDEQGIPGYEFELSKYLLGKKQLATLRRNRRQGSMPSVGQGSSRQLGPTPGALRAWYHRAVCDLMLQKGGDSCRIGDHACWCSWYEPELERGTR